MPTPPTAYDETAKGPGLSGLLEIVRRRRVLAVLPFLFVLTAVAAHVANTIASLYSEENGRMREQQAVSTSEFLENQLRELREKLQKQEHAITTYKEKYLGELPEQKDVNLRTLERLQAQLQLAHENNRRATERRQMLTDALGQIDTSVAMTSPGGSGISVTPADTAAARLNLLRQELAMAQTRFSDKYPDVVQLKEQIRVLEQKVETEKQAAQALPKSVAHASKRGAGGRELRTPPENAYVQSLMTQLDQATVEAKTTSEEMQNINAQIATVTRRLDSTPKREQELALL